MWLIDIFILFIILSIYREVVYGKKQRWLTICKDGIWFHQGEINSYSEGRLIFRWPFYKLWAKDQW
jgi:hypothetical protein